MLLADCEETVFPSTELVKWCWFFLTFRAPGSRIPRHVHNEQVLITRNK